MEKNENEQELTIRDILRVLFKHKISILATLLAALATVYVGLLYQTPVFEAEVKMLVSAKKQIESSYYRELVDFRKADITLTQSEIVKSNPVLERTVLFFGLQERPKDYERKFASSLKVGTMDFLIFLKKVFNNIYALFIKPPVEMPMTDSFRIIQANDDLKNNINIEQVKDTDLFVIKVEDYDPALAAAMANVISRSYIIFDLEQQLAELQLKFGSKHQSVIQLEDNIKTLISSLSGEKLANVDAIGPASVKVIDQASFPLSPAGKPKIFFYLIAIILGLLLGVVQAFAAEYFDQSFKSPQEAQDFFKAPFLGSIPQNRDFDQLQLMDIGQKNNPIMHSVNSLSDQIYLFVKDKKMQTILFTSSDNSSLNQSVLVANLAHVLGNKTGLKVAVVDADLHNSAIHQIFGIKDNIGIVELLEDKIELQQAFLKISDNLCVIPAGKTELNPVTLLDSNHMRGLLDMLQKSFDVVLINGPDLKQLKEVGVLSMLIKKMVMIVHEGKTRRHTVRALISSLIQKDVELVGIILNQRTYFIPKMIYDRV